jgi:hypothetical protein
MDPPFWWEGARMVEISARHRCWLRSRDRKGARRALYNTAGQCAGERANGIRRQSRQGAPELAGGGDLADAGSPTRSRCARGGLPRASRGGGGNGVA